MPPPCRVCTAPDTTSADQIITHGSAQRGSVHHRFPGRRAQLIDEAVAPVVNNTASLIDTATRADDITEAIDSFFALR
ncbi:hypothetical protein [Streptomyces sp. NPDC058678]|uniref:hypothetical protein n=1 Tax=Streptomyces sp. NPDC058678 TaxID=3346595 RepID=UPI00364D62E6